MAEPREAQSPAPEHNPFRHFVGQVVIHIPGVRSHENSREGTLETNLSLQHLEKPDEDPRRKENLINEVVTNFVEPPPTGDSEQARKNRTWFQNMITDVTEGKRSVVWIPTAGAIIFTVGAAGYEFGIRHAKDIRELAHLAEEFKKRINPRT